MLNTFVVVFIFASTMFHRGSCFGSGAPPWQCNNMMPHHRGAPPQRGPSPYIIRVQRPYYTPGENVQVALLSSRDTIMGYLIQARRVGDNAAIGTFAFQPRNGKFLSCGNRQRSAITHSSRLRSRFVSFAWVPPPGLSGNIAFYATVVKDMTTFWVRLQSPVLSRRDQRVRQ